MPDLTTRGVRALQDAAAALADSDQGLAREVICALAGNDEVGGRWLRAALLERLGQHGEAASELEATPALQSSEIEAVRLAALCRARLASGDGDEAARALRDSTRLAQSYHTLAVNARLLARLERLAKPAARRVCRVALLGNTNFELLAPILRITAFAAGIDLVLYAGGFGQQTQEILDPASPLQSFHPEVVFFATDWRVLGLSEESAEPGIAVSKAISDLRMLWSQCRHRFGAYVVQHNFEVPEVASYGRLSAALPGGRSRILKQINVALQEAAAVESSVAILDFEQAAATFGKRHWYRATEWHTARQYPAAALPHLARHQIALLRAVLGLSAKALILDLDGVLWGGVVGEDGVGGIILGSSGAGEAYRDFQRYIKTLRKRGVLLAVCSKNNDADARAPFFSHPDSILGLGDFAAFVANWDSKDENLRRIATQLRIGLDSFVFLDDNPVEREWVRRRLPEVEVPELPADPSEFISALDRGRHFEALALTAEDRNRSRSFRADTEREMVRQTSATLEEFLQSLEMQIDLRPFEEVDLPRIVQLIQRTNQFNLTGRRHNEAEVRRMLGVPSTYTQALRLRDRFGDSGLVGALIAVREAKTLSVDTWVLSCRVLGRRLPEASFAAMCRYALATGCRALIGAYYPTPKN